MQSFVSVLNSLGRNQGWEKHLEQHQLFLVWEQVADDDFRAHSTPLRIVKDVLWLEVDTSAWVNQFQYQKYSLLDSLNTRFSKYQLTDIRFQLAEKKKPEKTARKKVRFVSPDPEERSKFDKQIEIIDDEKSREALARLWYLAHACIRPK